MTRYHLTPKQREDIRQRMEDAIMDRPGPPEITVTFRNGCVESVGHIHRGQTVVTRDIDDDGIHDHEIVIQRWYFDSSSKILYEGSLEEAPSEENLPKVDNYDTF